MLLRYFLSLDTLTFMGASRPSVSCGDVIGGITLHDDGGAEGGDAKELLRKGVGK
jgi:hypothetical protein